MTQELPPVLLPYQQRWYMDRSPVKVGEKSRRIGLTWATAAEAVETAATRARDGGSNFWYQTYAEDDAKEFIEDCAKWAQALEAAYTVEVETLDEDTSKKYFVLPEGVRSVQVTSIRFTSGHRIVALPHSPRKLRGKGGVYCLDEAAYHDDVKGVLKAAEAFRMWGGRIIIISTHNGVDNEFNKLCEDIKAGRRKWSLHKYTLLDAVNDGLYKRICLVNQQEWTQELEDEWVNDLLSTEGADEEFLCIPARSGGQYIPLPLIDACMCSDYPVLQLRLDDEFAMRSEEERTEHVRSWTAVNIEPLIMGLDTTKPHYFGVDFGRASDMSVFAFGYLDQMMGLHVRFMVELFNCPYEQQKQLLFTVVDQLPNFNRGALDSTGNGEYLGEQALFRYGEELIDACKINNPWYAAVLPKVRARFEDQDIYIPRDVDVRQDLGMFQLIDGIPKLPKMRLASKNDKTIKRHGDAGIAIACLTLAATHEPASFAGYRPVPKRAGHFGSMKGII